jgi:hypothetical protein
MKGMQLALPLLVLAGAASELDAMGSRREVDPFFASLEVFQPLEASLFFVGLRVTGVSAGRFGFEAGASTTYGAKMGELSALGVFRLAGDPVLLRAGLSHMPGEGGTGDHGPSRSSTGLHAGASLLTGGEGDRVRVRLDYTYRWLPSSGRGFSSLGIGLVFPMQ